MHKRCTLILLLLSSLNTAGGIYRARPTYAPLGSRLFIITVHHDECTECGDFEIESGKVVVPVAMRERYLQAFTNSPRSGSGSLSDRYARLLARCQSDGWRVGNVKLESEKEFDALFLLPGKKRSDSNYLNNYPWDFNKRYRATVEVTGIKWSYLTVRVLKAVRLADRKD